MYRVAALKMPAFSVDASRPTSSVLSHSTTIWKMPAMPRGAVKRQNFDASTVVGRLRRFPLTRRSRRSALRSRPQNHQMPMHGAEELGYRPRQGDEAVVGLGGRRRRG